MPLTVAVHRSSELEVASKVIEEGLRLQVRPVGGEMEDERVAEPVKPFDEETLSVDACVGTPTSMEEGVKVEESEKSGIVTLRMADRPSSPLLASTATEYVPGLASESGWISMGTWAVWPGFSLICAGDKT